MSKVYFLFGIHNHQPAGNDLFVFNKAFEDCYFPFLNVLKEFPNIKCSIHVSGPLYDWLLSNKPDYIKDIKEMARAIKKIGEIKREDCRSHVEKYFTMQKMADEYEKVYERVIRSYIK